MFSFFLVCLSIVTGISAFIGPCIQPPTMEDFDMNAYLGTWYEKASTSNIMETGTKCPMANYVMNEQNTVNVNNTATTMIGDKKKVFEATASPSTDGKDGKFWLTPRSWITEGIKAPYWVVKTDYKKFAVVFSYIEFFFCYESVWILTREQHPTNREEIDQEVKKALVETKLDGKTLHESVQTGC